MKDTVLGKDKNEANTIIFMLYKEGIDEKSKEEIDSKIESMEEKGLHNVEISQNYAYLCKDYWSELFNSYNKQFIIDISNTYGTVEKDTHDFSWYSELYIKINNNDYCIKYCCEKKSLDSILIYFHIYNISVDNINYNQYNEELENLKFYIKKFWMKIMNKTCKCFWLEDTQSQYLSMESYKIINLLENRLRNFINKVMLYRHGVTWRDILDKSFIDKYRRKIKGYKNDIISYRDIDDFLLSLDSTDLIKIMKYESKEVVMKSKYTNLNNQLTDINTILSDISAENDINKYRKMVDKLVEIIDKNYTRPKVSFWNSTFSELFDLKANQGYLVEYEVEDNNVEFKTAFIENWKSFCEYRNHIAHNKFIDSHFYNKLKELSNNIEDDITAAELEFEAINKSYKYEEDDDIYNIKEFINKKGREYCIFREISYLAFRLNQVVEKTSGVISKIDDIFKNYSDIINNVNPNDSFTSFCGYFKTNFEKKIIDIASQDKSIDKLTLLLKKNRASMSGTLTSYTVVVCLNDELVEKILIGNDGYDFICDGIDEENEFLGGNWHEFVYKLCGLVKTLYLDNEQIEVIKKVEGTYYSIKKQLNQSNDFNIDDFIKFSEKQ